MTRTQLLDLDVGRRRIEGWTASGRLERVLPGVLQLAGAPKTREQLLFAAVLWGGTNSLASHRSAGELWGFDGVTASNPEITMPAAEVKRAAGIVVHQTRSSLKQRRTRRGVPTTTPERTLIDLAGVLRPEQLEVAFESARRERHVTAASVERTLARIGARGRRGGEVLQHLLRELGDEPPCESALEVMTARMLRASDLPRSQRQVNVNAFGNDYRLDFAWPAELVALECDGRKWHEIERDFERDRQRWSAITAATGYRIVWATWRQVKGGREQIVTALRELFAQAAEPPSPRVRGLRRRPERSVGIGMTLSIDESTMVSRARRERDAPSVAPTSADADG